MSPEHACPFCSGSGLEFTADGGTVRCLLCDGSGYAVLVGDLGPTHTQERRPFTFDAANRRLGIGLGRRAAVFVVSEFAPADGHGGRAFLLLKNDGITRYACRLGGADGPLCDCGGATFGSTVKANFRAHLRFDPQYPTLGCRHVDALSVLVKGGWLDLPEHVPLELSDE